MIKRIREKEVTYVARKKSTFHKLQYKKVSNAGDQQFIKFYIQIALNAITDKECFKYGSLLKSNYILIGINLKKDYSHWK
mgnify:CR=1 FL=1